MMNASNAHREHALAYILDLIGITHEPSKIEGKRDWFDCYGDLIGTFDVNDGWAEVHSWCLDCADADDGIPNREMRVVTDFDQAKRGMVH